MKPTTYALGFLILASGCAPENDPIAWAMIEARTGKTRAQVEKEESDHRATMKEYADKEKREMEAYRKAEQKRTADRQRLTTEFCALSPMQRDSKVQAWWDVEKNRPGSPYRSYGHMRADMIYISGC